MSAPSRYRLDLAYVGDAFYGWQSQPDGRGVQDAVEKALATFLRHPVRVTGASRTDTGVHAEMQVATFETEVPFNEWRWVRALHGLLPNGIGVRALAPATAQFHPILSSNGKAYRYRVWLGEKRFPQLLPFVWAGHPPLDVAAMRAGAAALVGKHDFSSFCAADSSAKTRERTIFELEIRERGELLDIWVVGDGFLKQMVRSIVGTLVEVARGGFAAADVAKVLAARDRKLAGATAPAHGLSLVEIFYGEVGTVAELEKRAAAGFGIGT